jgi:hypothetical protein
MPDVSPGINERFIPMPVPANTALPTISGIAQTGQTLMASPGSWTNTPTSFIYQWNRGGIAISGAVGATYVPIVDDVGFTLTVSVIAVNASGTSTPTSAPTAVVVQPAVPVNVTKPTISGIAQVGKTLTASTGTWM